MSGLEDLYREIILDHYRSPRNRGELEVYDGATVRLLETELSRAAPARAAVILDLLDAKQVPLLAPTQRTLRLGDLQLEILPPMQPAAGSE